MSTDHLTQDLDPTYARRFMKFAVERRLDIDDPDWPQADVDAWDAIAAELPRG